MRKAALTFIIGLFWVFTSAQNYYTKVKELTAYYDSLSQAKGPDSLKGTGYTQFKRWMDYWDPRLFPHGDFSIYENELMTYVNGYTRGSLQQIWKPVGSDKMPEGDSNYSSIPYSKPYSRGLGQIHYIEFDPNDNNKIFACSPVGGLFKSSNGGNNWVNAGTDKGLPRCGVSSIAIDPDYSTSRWLISTGNGEGWVDNIIWQETIGVYRTLDGGNTWENIGLSNTRVMRKIIKVPEISGITNGHYIVATGNGLYETKNAYATTPSWQLLISGEFYDVEVLPVEHSHIVFASGSRSLPVYKLELQNNNYQVSQLPDPDFSTHPIRRISLSVSPAAPDYLFAAVIIPEGNRVTDGRLYRYKISNNSWFFKGYFGSCDYGGSLGAERGLAWNIAPALNTNNDLSIVGGNSAPLYYADNLLDDSPLNWVKIAGPSYGNLVIHVDFHYITFTTDGQVLWAASDGGAYKTTAPDFTNWEEMNNGLQVSTIYHIANSEASGKKLSGQFDCGTNLHELDAGTWKATHILTGDGFQCIFDPEDPSIFYVSMQCHGIRKFLDYGATNTYAFNCDVADEIQDIWHTYYILNPANSKSMFLTSMLGIEWSPDRGDHCYRLPFEIPDTTRMTWRINLSKSDTNKIYVSWIGNQSTRQKIYKSSFTGNYIDNVVPEYEWNEVTGFPVDKWINAIQVDDNNPDIIWVAAGEYVYKVNTASNPPLWEDISSNKGIQGNVRCLEKLKDDITGVIFAATDYGVYYYTPHAGAWINYSENLPNVVVEDIEIDYTRNTIIAGTFGRGMWEADLPCYEGITHTITTPTIWNTNTRVNSDIYIQSGASLTIANNAVALMGESHSIIVEPGAKLIVDNATITSGCEDFFWSGIQVWGNPGLSQMNKTAQGVVILKNGTVVENAENVLQAIKVNPDGSLDWSKTGGIVYAEDASFINNKRGIWIGGYHNFNPDRPGLKLPNRSYVKDCLFKIDDNYIFEGTGFHFFIGLCSVDGIRIYGNDFVNGTSMGGFTQRGSGIVAYDASFNARYSCPTSWPYLWPCSGYKKNHFEGLNYGISVFNDNTGKPLIVDMCEFVNNYRGVLLTGCSNARITNNDFQVPNVEPGYEPPGPYNNASDREPYGLYMNGSTRFYVEENNFQSYDTEFGKNESTNGLIVNNSFDNNNELYKNNFFNLQWGFTALNINRGQGSYDPGLKLFCNNFSDHSATNYNDIDVSFTLPELPVVGIAKYQRDKAIVGGTPYDLPAENVFSHDCYKPDADFDNDHGAFLFYCHSPGDANDGDHWVPKCHSNIVKVPLSYPSEVEPCESKTEDFTRPLPEHLANLALAHQEVVIKKAMLSAWVNGGIENLEELIENVEEPDAYVEFNDLMGMSPYLDEEVLYEFVMNPVFTPLMVKLLCLANPQSSHSGMVIDALYCREPQMPQAYIDEILAEEGTYSPLEDLESYVAASQHHYKQIAGHVIMNYLNDTIDECECAFNNLVNFISNEKDLNSRYELASVYLEHDMQSEMYAMLDEIPLWCAMNDYEMSGEEWGTYWEYMGYFNTIPDIRANIHNLSQSDIDWLENTANYSVRPFSYRALSLLKQNDENYAYAEPIMHSDESQYRKSRRVRRVQEQPLLKVYPNPAMDYVTLEYRTGGVYQDVRVEMLDMTGRVLLNKKLQGGDNEELLDLRGMKPGIYLIQLMGDGKPVESQVISIVSR